MNVKKYIQQNFPIPGSKHRPQGVKESIVRFFNVLRWSMSYHETHTNLIILTVSVIGLISSLIRYELIELLEPNDHTHILYYIIWICVLVSAINCCRIYTLIYFDLALNFDKYFEAWKHTVLKHNYFLPFIALVLSLSISIFAVFRLYTDMVTWGERIIELGLPAMWFYRLLLVFRITQHFLSCMLITAIGPVNYYWLRVSSQQYRECMVQLLPWHLFHMFQRALMLAALKSIANQNLESILYFLFIQLYKLWIPAMALTIANCYIFPILYVPRSDERVIKERLYYTNTETDKVMVTGLTTPTVYYPPHTELVRGGALDRFRNFLHPLLQNPSSQTDSQSSREGSRHSNWDYSFITDEDVPPQSKSFDKEGREERDDIIMERNKDPLHVQEKEEETLKLNENMIESAKMKDEIYEQFEDRTLIDEEIAEFGIADPLPDLQEEAIPVRQRHLMRGPGDINEPSD